MKECLERYKELMAFDGFEKLTAEEAIEQIGDLINCSMMLVEAAGADRAISWCQQVRTGRLAANLSALLHYFESNAWCVLRSAAMGAEANAWDWQGEAVTKEVLHLRLAQRDEGFGQLHTACHCQILT